jgi:hypothetical protein
LGQEAKHHYPVRHFSMAIPYLLGVLSIEIETLFSNEPDPQRQVLLLPSPLDELGFPK